jgi:hypothetical protein
MKHLLTILLAVLCSVANAAAPNFKLLHYQGIGNQAVTADNPRALPKSLLDNGWGPLYASFEPMAAQGLRRWILWTPFGQDPVRTHWYQDGDGVWKEGKAVIRVEQMSNCRKLGGKHEKLCDTFVAETKKFLAAGPNRELIAYLGMVIGAPEWTPDGSTEADEPYSVAGLKRRMDAELQPYLDAGCSLAFDMSSALPKTHWFYQYLQGLKKKTKVYIEAWPGSKAEHLSGENGIMLTDQFLNYTEQTIGKFFLDPHKITGEKQVWVLKIKGSNGESPSKFLRQIVPALLADPYVDTVAFPVDYYLKDGGKIEELSNWQSMLKAAEAKK